MTKLGLNKNVFFSYNSPPIAHFEFMKQDVNPGNNHRKEDRE